MEREVAPREEQDSSFPGGDQRFSDEALAMLERRERDPRRFDADGRDLLPFLDIEHSFLSTAREGNDLLWLVEGDSRFTEKQKTNFRADMESFERRAKERGLPKEEVAGTYMNLSRLLNSGGNTPVSAADKALLARQLLEQCADPTSIDQGFHKSCSVTAIESVLYAKSPATATGLVVDLAVDGSYRTPKGTEIKLTKQDYVKDSESNRGREEDRSFATQLFNIAAVNVWYKENGLPMRYTNNPKPDGRSDTGERLIDERTGKEIARDPHFTGVEIMGVYKSITGEKRNDWMLQSRSMEVDRNGVPLTNAGTYIGNEKELATKLSQMKKENRLPVTIGVHTGAEPFWTDSGYGTAGGSGGWHVVNVTDFDARSGRVSVDNQWGAQHDHNLKPIPLRDLFIAMKPPRQQIGQLQMNADGARISGNPDEFSELEIQRIRESDGLIGESQLADKMVSLARQFEQTWQSQKASGQFDKVEHSRVQEKFQHMLTSLAKPHRETVLKGARESSLLTADQKQAGQKALQAEQRQQAARQQQQSQMQFRPRRK